jgi:hypothetical protein
MILEGETPIHQPLILRPRHIASFWLNVRHIDGECVLWTGCTFGKSGLAGLSVNGRLRLAKRVAYVIHFGVDPGTAQVRQACGNKLCVSKAHLYLVNAEKQ